MFVTQVPASAPSTANNFVSETMQSCNQVAGVACFILCFYSAEGHRNID